MGDAPESSDRPPAAPPAPRPRRPWAAAALAGAAVAALAIGLALRGGSPPPGSTELAPVLRPHVPLEAGSTTRFEVALGHHRHPLEFERRVAGWEQAGGLACARVTYREVEARRRDLYVTEWLHPAGDRLLCAQRRIGLDVFTLDPPQPVLVAPPEPGRAWTWQGRVNGRRARAEFRILPAEDPGPGGPASPGASESRAVRVEQRTTVGGSTSIRVQVRVPGRGLVAEDGDFPAADPDRERVRVRARRSSPAPASSTW